jgi:hypothetical protein
MGAGGKALDQHSGDGVLPIAEQQLRNAHAASLGAGCACLSYAMNYPLSCDPCIHPRATE